MCIRDRYGILYSVLPDCNRKDGLSEVIFHTEAVPRVNICLLYTSGIEEDNSYREYNNPDDEGILYDNLD